MRDNNRPALGECAGESRAIGKKHGEGLRSF